MDKEFNEWLWKLYGVSFNNARSIVEFLDDPVIIYNDYHEVLFITNTDQGLLFYPHTPPIASLLFLAVRKITKTARWKTTGLYNDMLKGQWIKNSILRNRSLIRTEKSQA